MPEVARGRENVGSPKSGVCSRALEYLRPLEGSRGSEVARGRGRDRAKVARGLEVSRGPRSLEDLGATGRGRDRPKNRLRNAGNDCTGVT